MTESSILRRVPFGNLGVDISRLGLGTYCLTSERDIRHDTAIKTVRHAVGRGVNLLDTAPLYGAGEAQQLVGEALIGSAPAPIIIDKVGRFEASIVRRRAEEAYRNPALIRAQAEHGLRTIRRDRVDVMLIHESDDPAWWEEPDKAKGPVMGALEDLRAEGRIGHIGLSVRDPDRAVALIETGRFDVLLYVHYYNFVWQEPGDAVLEVAERRGMGIVIGAPYRRGALLDGSEETIAARRLADHPDYPPGVLERLRRAQQLADAAGIPLAEMGLRFLLSDGRVDSVLVGAEDITQLDENISWATAGPLRDDLLASIRALREVPLAG